MLGVIASVCTQPNVNDYYLVPSCICRIDYGANVRAFLQNYC